MKKKIILLITLLMFGLCLPLARASTIEVDDDLGEAPEASYTSIQEAINASNPQDTILVYPGVYQEALTIDKQLNITTVENHTTTEIRAPLGEQTIIYIQSSNVTIKGFTIKGAFPWECTGIMSSDHYYLEVSNNKIIDCLNGLNLQSNDYSIIANNTLQYNQEYGAYIEHSDNIEIIDNAFIENKNGLYTYYSQNIKLFKNNIINNDNYGLNMRNCNNGTTNNNNINNNEYGVRIHTWSENYVNIYELNHITNNTYGIVVNSEVRTNIINNTLIDNNYALSFYNSNNNLIENNTLNNNIYGIYSDDTTNNNYIENRFNENTYNLRIYGSSASSYAQKFTNNTVNNRTITYLVSQSNKVIITDSAFIGLINCFNITVKGAKVENNYDGVLVAYSQNCTIENTTTTNTYNGIKLISSAYNTIKLCNLTETQNGIESQYSPYNTIIDNTIIDYESSGIYQRGTNDLTYSTESNKNMATFNNTEIKIYSSSTNPSSHNIIKNNLIKGNKENKGIYLYRSDQNNIINNTVSNTRYGIFDEFSQKNTIEHNKITKNYYGIRNYYSEYNIINNNNIHNNTSTGISLDKTKNTDIKYNIIKNNSRGINIGDSTDNNLLKNVIRDNYGYAIQFYRSNQNKIINNTLINNNYGIRFDTSSSNIVYRNNFDNKYNEINSYSDSFNSFNSSEFFTYVYNGVEYGSRLGNYWSDYNGYDSDGDGVGDVPYQLTDNQYDYYPLMLPIEHYSQGGPYIEVYQTSESQHVDIGLQVTLFYRCRWINNNSDVTTGTLYINEEATPINSTGYAKITVIENKPTTQTYTVTGIQVNDVSTYQQTIQSPTVTWDAIQITDSGYTPSPVYVAEPATIWYKTRYAVSQSQYTEENGYLEINNQNASWSKTRNRWEHNTTILESGTYNYTVTKINETTHGLTTIIENQPLTIEVLPTDIILESTTIYPGWNLIALPDKLLHQTPEELLGEKLEYTESIFTYDNQEKRWLTWINGIPEQYQTIENLNGLKGYWIYASEQYTLEIRYYTP